MKYLGFVAILSVLGIAGPATAQPVTTKAGIVYCNNVTGFDASCAMYYYSRPEGRIIRGTKTVPARGETKNIINITTNGPAIVNINSGTRKAPDAILIENHIGAGATFETSKLNWTTVGAGAHCATPVVTCTLKEIAVLDTGCSCGTPKGRVRGIVIP